MKSWEGFFSSLSLSLSPSSCHSHSPWFSESGKGSVFFSPSGSVRSLDNFFWGPYYKLVWRLAARGPGRGWGGGWTGDTKWTDYTTLSLSLSPSFTRINHTLPLPLSLLHTHTHTHKHRYGPWLSYNNSQSRFLSCTIQRKNAPLYWVTLISRNDLLIVGNSPELAASAAGTLCLGSTKLNGFAIVPIKTLIVL